ncbi:MAG: DNA phosphorothioation-dependent restriction protein DptH, partial [Clostridium sp.]|nr:DNA phosphorothioation-dependent restriction protein DptH [Clostridium sp.]
MLNQFYNYLAIKLNGYFKNTSPGERFYLQFDEADQVRKFYEALENLPKTENFTYKHAQGTPYETFMINHQQAGIVVAATIGGITPDYLVTLRNEVSEQQNEWENKALLIVCSETLDSIKGGSSDLQKEGMPFHVDQLTKNIIDEIMESKLKPYEKEILKFHLNQKREDTLFKTNLWDYEEVLGFIYGEKIQDHAYEKLNLFRDDTLETFTVSKMKKRISENAELFEKVNNAHHFDDVDLRLSRFLTEKGVNKLKKDKWTEVPYKDVNSYKEDFNQERKQTLVYRESPQKVTQEGISFWERPLGDKGNRSNKRQIILFNPQGIEELTLKFSFDDVLKSELIDIKSQSFVKTSGKKLEMTLAHNKGGTSFYRVIYNHNKNPKTRFQFDVCVIETISDNLKGIMTKFEIDGRKETVVLQCDYNEIFFGPETGDINLKGINTAGEEVFLDEGESFRIDEGSQAWESDSLSFTVNFNGAKLPILIKDENNKVIPIDSSRIWKLKREAMDDFYYDVDSGKLRQGSKEYASYTEMRPFLHWEKEWIHAKMFSAQLDGEEIKKLELSLPYEIDTTYLAILDW